MASRADDLLQRVRDTVLSTPGALDPWLRRAVAGRAMGASPNAGPPELPADLTRLADTVTRHAYRVTDEDVDALRAAGWSEDVILEVMLSAAVGAGLHRWQRGMAALRAEG